MKPKVTIGVCVKNAEKTITDAINSVVHSDFSHKLMEIIIVDGQSKDRTLENIKEILSKSDVRSIVLSENKGLGFARQTVVDNAKGDYIIWVDGDMILTNDYIGKQVEFMDNNLNVGIATGCHGILPEANVVAALEDVAYIAIDSKFRGSNSSKLPGTAGAVFRVEAIRQVGGFDSHIRGVGEDIQAAYRIKKTGWLIYRGTEAVFYEKRKESWKELWDHYVWYGYGGYYLIRKNGWIFDLWKMVPPAGFIAGIWYSLIAYRIMHQKMVFWLPLQTTFKRIAWCFGFVKGQIERYKRSIKWLAKVT